MAISSTWRQRVATGLLAASGLTGQIVSQAPAPKPGPTVAVFTPPPYVLTAEQRELLRVTYASLVADKDKNKEAIQMAFVRACESGKLADVIFLVQEAGASVNTPVTRYYLSKRFSTPDEKDVETELNQATFEANEKRLKNEFHDDLNAGDVKADIDAAAILSTGTIPEHLLTKKKGSTLEDAPAPITFFETAYRNIDYPLGVAIKHNHLAVTDFLLGLKPETTVVFQYDGNPEKHAFLSDAKTGEMAALLMRHGLGKILSSKEWEHVGINALYDGRVAVFRELSTELDQRQLREALDLLLINSDMQFDGEALQVLKERGLNFLLPNEDGKYIFFKGLRTLRAGVSEFVLDEGFNPNTSIPISRSNAPDSAVHVWFMELRAALNDAERYSNPKKRDQAIAAAKKILAALVRHGANLNEADSDGATLAEKALITLDVDVVGMLYAQGADFRSRQFEGKTASDHLNDLRTQYQKELREAPPLSSDQEETLAHKYLENQKVVRLYDQGHRDDTQREALQKMVADINSVLDDLAGKKKRNGAAQQRLTKTEALIDAFKSFIVMPLEALREKYADTPAPVAANVRAEDFPNEAPKAQEDDLYRSIVAGNLPAFIAELDAHGGLTSRYMMDTKLGIGGGTLLHVAAKYGKTEIAAFLIDIKHIPTDVANNRGETAFVQAARSGQAEMMRFLQGRGAHVDAVTTDFGEWNALNWAVDSGDSASVQAAVDAKVPITPQRILHLYERALNAGDRAIAAVLREAMYGGPRMVGSPGVP